MGFYKQPSYFSRTIILIVLLLKYAYQVKGAECLVNWKIITKAIVIGEETKLECDIRDTITCPGIPKWTGGPANQIITVGDLVFHPEKYVLTRSPGKYILTIRNIGKEDLNSRYSCLVRFSKYEALLKDKNPTYSLKITEPKSLQEDLILFANISAFPVNRTEAQHVWFRYPVNNAINKKELQDSKKFQEKVEDDGISLIVRNRYNTDINMTYELLYNNVTFSADDILSLKSNDDSVKSSFDHVEVKWIFIAAGVSIFCCLFVVYRKYFSINDLLLKYGGISKDKGVICRNCERRLETLHKKTVEFYDECQSAARKDDFTTPVVCNKRLPTSPLVGFHPKRASLEINEDFQQPSQHASSENMFVDLSSNAEPSNKDKNNSTPTNQTTYSENKSLKKGDEA